MAISAATKVDPNNLQQKNYRTIYVSSIGQNHVVDKQFQPFILAGKFGHAGRSSRPANSINSLARYLRALAPGPKQPMIAGDARHTSFAATSAT
jgi:hypothetical protein